MPSGPGFAIMSISYEEKSMRVVDLGKLRLLPDSNSCNKTFINTSAKLHRPFWIDTVNLNLAIYNCTTKTSAAAQDRELVETRMRCGNESRVFVGVEGMYNETSVVEGCDAAVILPVLAAPNGEANASDYDRLIRDGFLLRWDSELAQFNMMKRNSDIASLFRKHEAKNSYIKI